MSNVETAPEEELCGAEPASDQTFELLHGREVQLTPRSGTLVTRTLPNRDRRMVGAWCFLDQYGPTYVGQGVREGVGEGVGGGMSIAAHPHTGLQTVSWLVAGEIHHYDSLDNSKLIRPRQLNLMTAGRGIAHAELSPEQHSDILHGAQLWVALPSEHAGVAPHFEHHAHLPVMDSPGVTVTVIMGSVDGATSPAETYSPLLGAEIALDADAAVKLPLRKDFEHAILVLSGAVEIGPITLEQGPLLYLGKGREEIRLVAHGPSRALLLGGEPFDEEIVMWWNFVGRDHEEIVQFRQEWESSARQLNAGQLGEGQLGEGQLGGGQLGGGRFRAVGGGYSGGTLPAPPLPTTRLKPRGRTR